jgi:hypothetical protein
MVFGGFCNVFIANSLISVFETHIHGLHWGRALLPGLGR